MQFSPNNNNMILEIYNCLLVFVFGAIYGFRLFLYIFLFVYSKIFVYE